MKQFFITVAGVVTGLFAFTILGFVLLFGVIAAAVGSASSQSSVASHSVLELDLRQGLTDQPPVNPFAAFGGSGLSVVQVIDGLAQAEADSRVKVLLIRLPESGMTPAAADELRQAIHRFRAAGKTVIAHSQGFMPVGAAVSTYMVGAATGELWMQNTASFQATGLSIDSLFLGRAFQRYGVEADLEQRYEYKNAANEYTQGDFTEPHREAMLAWMGSIYETALANAAHDREQTPQAMKAAIEGGPWTAEQAKEKGLVDRIGHVEEAEAEARRRAGRNARIVPFGDYVSSQGPRVGAGRHAIAIVGGEGAIMTGTGGGGDPFGSGSMMMSDDIAEAIYQAIENKDVKAIVFRVSSPGGSPEASEQILAAVRAARAAGKPVVVSMGAYAASGGYWVSAEADHIVAQPSTLTGSIGVFGGKFVLSDALGRFGLDLRGLSVGGDYADAYSSTRRFTPAQRTAVSAAMDRIYEDFVTRVSIGRELPVARVREIARGRVWTGAQALELGLVDELGGLAEAIAAARRLADIPEGDSVRFIRYPAPKSAWEALSAAFGVQQEAARALVMLGGVMADPDVRAAAGRVRTERMRETGAVVLADEPLR